MAARGACAVRLASVLLLASSAAITTTATATATTTRWRDGSLRSRFAGERCLQTSGSSVRTKGCFDAHSDGTGSAVWAFDSVRGTLENFATGSCLGVAGAGKAVSLVGCQEDEARWQWGDKSQLRSQSKPSLCLDVFDPFGVGPEAAAAAAWGWQHSDNLVLGTNNCTGSHSQNSFHLHPSASPATSPVTVFNAVAASQPATFTFSPLAGSGTAASVVRVQVPPTGRARVRLAADVAWNVSVVVTGNEGVVGTTQVRVWRGASYTVVGYSQTNPAGLLVDAVPHHVAHPVTNDFKALLRVVDASGARGGIEVTYTTSDCYRCSPRPLTSVHGSGSPVSSFEEVNPAYEITVFVTSANFTLTRKHKYGFGGMYTLTVSQSDVVVSTDKRPVQTWVPLVVALAVLVGLACVVKAATVGLQKWREYRDVESALDKSLLEADQPQRSQQVHRPAKKDRLQSLDSFRGVCLMVMMFVNFGGGGYYYFNHSTWNGLTVADLVFPWFMWIMGTSLAISLSAMTKKSVQTASLLAKTARRSATLFCLGAFLEGVVDWSTVRVCGVLQYFAVSYFVISLIAILVPKIDVDSRTLHFVPLTGAFGDVRIYSGPLADVIPRLLEWALALVLPIVYLTLQQTLPVPGCPTGYIEAGGAYGSFGEHPYCTGGAHRYIDTAVVGASRVYRHPTADALYEVGPYDPEGVLGMLTACFMTFLGLQAGRIVVAHKSHSQRIARWVVWGTLECALAAALCSASKNDGVLPVNKNLWSPSFILVMAGSGNLMLALCYLLVDVWKVWGGMPCKAVGMNSIFIYIMHEHFSALPVPFGSGYQTHAVLLAQHLWSVGLWTLVAVWMHSKRLFLTV